MVLSNEYKGFLDKYIPSADVREKVLETGHQFSKWERAAIIWNSVTPLLDRHRELQMIADDTSDDTLREQIIERIRYDNDALEIFADRSEGCVYLLYSSEHAPEEDLAGVFGSSDLAAEEGCKIGFRFAVEKHQVLTKNTAKVRGRSITSPVIEPDVTKQIEETDYYSALARVEYDPHGKLLSFWTNEIPMDREIRVNTLSNKRFENRFVFFPRSFNANDRVRVVGMGDTDNNGMVGRISCGPQDYEEFIRTAMAPNSIVDYSDAAIRVDYEDKDGNACDHAHILPIYLERVYSLEDDQPLCKESRVRP